MDVCCTALQGKMCKTTNNPVKEGATTGVVRVDSLAPAVYRARLKFAYGNISTKFTASVICNEILSLL